MDSDSSWTLVGIVSAALIQECGRNDFVLFTNVAKFSDWIEEEVNKTYSNNNFHLAFDAFDQENENSRNLNTNCKYQSTG
jgi:secreted trypsin-like serine protease